MSDCPSESNPSAAARVQARMLALPRRGNEGVADLAAASPRPGYTPHPLTLRAAEAMRSVLERADRFRPGPRA